MNTKGLVGDIRGILNLVGGPRAHLTHTVDGYKRDLMIASQDNGTVFSVMRLERKDAGAAHLDAVLVGSDGSITVCTPSFHHDDVIIDTMLDVKTVFHLLQHSWVEAQAPRRSPELAS